MGPRGEVNKGLSQAKRRRQAQIEATLREWERQERIKAIQEDAALAVANRERLARVHAAAVGRVTA